MKWKKIVAIGIIGAMSIGLLGCTSKVPVEQYNADIAAQASEYSQKLVQLDLEKSLENEKLAAELESAKLKLTEKDKEVLALTEQFATEAEAEAEAEVVVLPEEAVDDLDLSNSVPTTRLDADDISFLKEGVLDFDGDDYDFEEAVYLNDLYVGVSTDSGKDEFDKTPYLLFTEEGSVKYSYELKDEFKYEEVTEDEPLEINFLGKTFKIIDIEEDELTYKQAQTFFVTEGQSVTVEGKMFTLTAVTNGKVYVVSGNEGRSITEGDLDEINGLEVRVQDVTYQDYAGGIHRAELEFGDEVLVTVSDGEEYIEDDETYVWGISTDGDVLESISVSYNLKLNDLDEDEGKILAPTESLNFLDYFSLVFDHEETYDYKDFEFRLTDITNDDIAVVEVKGDEKTLRFGTEKLDKVYLSSDNIVYYKEDGDWKSSTETLKLVNKDMELELYYDSVFLTIGTDIKITTDLKTFQKENEAESTDVLIYGTAVGEVEESLLLDDGVIVKSIENNSDKDELRISIPNEEVQMKLSLKKN